MKKYEGLYLVEQEENWKTNQTEIFTFSRLKNGEKVIERIDSFRPYIYVDDDAPFTNTEEGFVSIFGDKVKKLNMISTKLVYPLRQKIEEKGYKHYEADIIFANRFLIDEVKEIEKADYKKFYIDIETLSEGGFPDVDATQQPIICLTIYDSFSKIYTTWIWREDFKKETLSCSQKEMRKFSNEKEMLQDVINFVKEEQPDIFLGWNVRHFDMKYLINRMKNIFRLNTGKMSPMNSVYITNNVRRETGNQRATSGDPVMKGIVIFDLLSYYRKVHKGELSSYSLNSVAEEELGEQKTDTYHVIDNDWKSDEWMNVIKYNIKDVELIVKIDEKCGVFDFFDQMRTIAHVNIDDCKYYGRVVDMFILRYAKQNNIVLPSKKPYNPDRVLEGGYVMEPKIGLHKNTIVIDLNTIYPNLINSFNLSPETRVEDGEINVNGIKFTKKFKGIVPSILDELGKLRTSFKSKMKELRYDDPEFKTWDMKQQAAKNLACTVYGVNALSTFRLNNDYIAQTITYLGRELVNWVKSETKKRGYETIYQDTDSCFIKLPDEFTIDECIVKGKELAKEINDKLTEFTEQFNVTEHTLGLDFEKVYSNYLLVAKKRYAGHVVWKDGDADDAIQLIGLDAKRSDSSKISKNLQKNIINMILKNKNKEEIIQYVKQVTSEIQSKSLVDVAIPVKFEKKLEDYKTNIPRVRGAKWANKNLNVNYTAGSKVLMLYTLGENDAICFEDESQIKPLNIEVDYNKMIEKLIFMKIEKIFNAMKWENDFISLQFSIKNKLNGQLELW